MNQLTKEQAIVQDLAMRIASLTLENATLRADLTELQQQAAETNGEVREVADA